MMPMTDTTYQLSTPAFLSY